MHKTKNIFLTEFFKAKQKNMRVSGYRPSLSLGHPDHDFFIVVFGFLQMIFADKYFQFLFL